MNLGARETELLKKFMDRDNATGYFMRVHFGVDRNPPFSDRPVQISKVKLSPTMKRIFGAYLKKGPDIFERYLRLLFHWMDEGNSEMDHDEKLFIVKHRDIFAAIIPPPKMPAVLYRGLCNLERVPKKGQNVIYTKKSQFTHLTENREIAFNFAKSYASKPPHGIVLEFPKAVIQEQTIFLWPYEDTADNRALFRFFDLDFYAKEREWAVQIKVPMKVSDWQTYGVFDDESV
jgi:hypothetical protein